MRPCGNFQRTCQGKQLALAHRQSESGEAFTIPPAQECELLSSLVTAHALEIYLHTNDALLCLRSTNRQFVD